MSKLSVPPRISGGGYQRLLTRDFCPWIRDWGLPLNQPIGWFWAATVVSVFVGLSVSPSGWVMAASLLAIIAVGCLWPWMAVRMVDCQLRPAVAEVHEAQFCELVFSVRNRWPIPLWGLAVEGYLDEADEASQPTLALACVPPCSEVEYRIHVRPQWRGQWPTAVPRISCSLPFGVWTARSRLHAVQPLTVLPQVFSVRGLPVANGRTAEVGEGLRSGQAGEPMGVRDFRQGDRLRNVHWVHTARMGQLIVCDRGGPARQPLQIVLDVRPAEIAGPEELFDSLLQLAWRVRIAASLAVHLHAHRVPLQIIAGKRAQTIAAGPSGRRQLLVMLGMIPLRGEAGAAPPAAVRGQVRISSSPGGDAVEVEVIGAAAGLRATQHRCLAIDWRCPVAPQLERFWQEVQHAGKAA